MESCIFCKIVSGEQQARVLYEDDLVIAVLDTDPISDGHTLVIPKQNIKDISELDAATGQRVMQVARLISSQLIAEFAYDGTMIMEVNGVFQDVPHFHLHVFGRNKQNDITITYPAYERNTDQEQDRIAEQLRSTLKNQSL